MTIDQYIKKLQRNAQQIKSEVSCYQGIVYEVTRRQEDRIFNKGIAGDGGPIGSYTGGPMYVNPSNPNNPRKFPTRGKTGKTKFNNGNPHKTGYFPSYAAYKKAVGRDAGNVNLTLTRKFRVAFANTKNIATVSADAIVISAGINYSKWNTPGKIKGILDKYPRAFMFTKGEREYAIKAIGQCMLNKLRA